MLRLLPAALLLLHAVFACQVPVFRYALERWQASRYELIIESGEALSPAEQEAVDFLIAKAGEEEHPINLSVRKSETAAGAGAAKMSLHYPGRLGGVAREPIWSGAVTASGAM